MCVMLFSLIFLRYFKIFPVCLFLDWYPFFIVFGKNKISKLLFGQGIIHTKMYCDKT